MMATVRHVTSGAGRTKFQSARILFSRVYTRTCSSGGIYLTIWRLTSHSESTVYKRKQKTERTCSFA